MYTSGEAGVTFGVAVNMNRSRKGWGTPNVRTCVTIVSKVERQAMDRFDDIIWRSEYFGN